MNEVSMNIVQTRVSMHVMSTISNNIVRNVHIMGLICYVAHCTCSTFEIYYFEFIFLCDT